MTIQQTETELQGLQNKLRAKQDVILSEIVCLIASCVDTQTLAVQSQITHLANQFNGLRDFESYVRRALDRLTPYNP